MVLRMRFFKAVLFLLFSSIIISCTSTKKIVYFRDVPDTARNSIVNTNIVTYSEPKISPNDILYVSVETLDPQANAVINSSITSSASEQGINQNANGFSGFLVDTDGYIELPLIERIKVAGTTTSQVREIIRDKMSIYFKNPVVNVRLSSFNVTILGEVNRPGTYNIANERATLLDILGMAGDLTIYAKRQNILLIREQYGKKIMTRLDITSSDIFNSPVFYLKPGDVLYIEPNKSKLAANDLRQARNLSILTSLVSLAIIVASRISF